MQKPRTDPKNGLIPVKMSARPPVRSCRACSADGRCPGDSLPDPGLLPLGPAKGLRSLSRGSFSDRHLEAVRLFVKPRFRVRSPYGAEQRRVGSEKAFAEKTVGNQIPSIRSTLYFSVSVSF